MSTSISTPRPETRLTALHGWLTTLSAMWAIDPCSLCPASSDASFRRYFRVTCANAVHPTLIVMDAPPAQEDCRPFVRVASLFAAAGVTVPQVLEQDLEQGFLLLTDLGSTTYLEQLQGPNGMAQAGCLYTDATDALLRIQCASQPGVLPLYDRPMLLREMQLFPDWYVGKHLGVTLSNTQHTALLQIFETLLDHLLGQPQGYVHRDYHARNLMVLNHGNPGILDFQDAVYGPLTYDLVSLWRDAYIEWDEAQQLDWLARYWEKAKKAALPVPEDFGAFYRDYEWMGLQRHLKVLGIFARLYHRDGKDGYLKDLPLVLRYIRSVAERYREFRSLARLLDQLENKVPTVGYTF